MLTVCHINLAKGFRGGERQTELLITALCRYDDLLQKAIIRKDSPLLPKLQKLRNLELLPVSKPYIKHARHIKYCDLIHVHEATAGQFAYLASRFYNRPYVITRRVPNPIKRNPLSSNVYLKAERIVALSGAIKDGLVGYNSRLKSVVIPSMVSNLPSSPESREKIRARYKDKFLVGHAGALVNHHKGQRYIIEAAKYLKNELPRIHFLLLGKGPDERWLKNMALGLDNLEFLGFHDNIGDFLGAFDLFIFPSLHEGLGSILLDAMQFRVPIAASAVGGIPDVVVHGKTGLLFPPADEKALAESIKCLYHNPQLGRELTENAFAASLNHQPQIIAEQYLQIYKEMARRNHPDIRPPMDDSK